MKCNWIDMTISERVSILFTVTSTCFSFNPTTTWGPPGLLGTIPTSHSQERPFKALKATPDPLFHTSAFHNFAMTFWRPAVIYSY